MCGIIAFKGEANACKIAFEGLKKLEYRGYDSWGIAFKDEDDGIVQFRKVGKISTSSMPKFSSGLAIAHTRWATHGSVLEKNSHPHLSNSKEFAVVHNGIIENYQELRKKLKAKGFNFLSDTDTEIIPNLIEYFSRQGHDFEEATKKALNELEGRYAIVAISKNSSKVLGAKKGSPLVLGIGENGTFLASDYPAFLNHTRKVIFLEDNEMVAINHKIKITDLISGNAVERNEEFIDLDVEEAELGEYDHFMLKEIMEQNQTILRAANQENIELAAQMINDAKGTFLIGCGTAGKVGMIGSYLFSRIANKHMNDTIGSEFPNYHHFIQKETLLFSISQSGETADTLEALEVAKEKGAKIISLINAMGSTMEKKSDLVLRVNAGFEKAVASTKATTNQIAILLLLAFASIGKLDKGKRILENCSASIGSMFEKDFTDQVHLVAKKLKDIKDLYIIGRGLSYPIALEAAIKLMEVPYINAQGFAGGELKHGPIALIEEGTPCIVIAPDDETKKDILANAMEVKSRGAVIIGLASENNEIFDYFIPVPNVGNASPIANLIPIQMLSYYLALERGNEIDCPKNLAKSVTVK